MCAYESKSVNMRLSIVAYNTFDQVLIRALCGLYMGTWHDSDSEGTRLLKEVVLYANIAYVLLKCLVDMAKTRRVRT